MGIPPTLPKKLIPDDQVLPAGTLVQLQLSHYSKSHGPNQIGIIVSLWDHLTYVEGNSQNWGYREGYKVYLINHQIEIIAGPEEIGEVLHESDKGS